MQVSDPVPDPPLRHRPQPHQGQGLQEVRLEQDCRHTGGHFLLFENRQLWSPLVGRHTALIPIG